MKGAEASLDGVSPPTPPDPREEEGAEEVLPYAESHGGERLEEGVGAGTTLSGSTLWRWKADYRKVFGEEPEGEAFEARLREALRALRERPGISRLEALELVKRSEGGRDKWAQAYVEVFGEEPNTEEARRRLEAAALLYDPERQIGRRKALSLVKEVEGRLQAPHLDATGVSLGAALVRLGRLEAKVEGLERMVERTHALANAANSRALNLHELVRTGDRSDDAALSLSELKETILALEARIAALESWVRRMGKYLEGLGTKKRRWPFW